MRFAGVDGCPAGWYVSVWDVTAQAITGRTCRSFEEVLDATRECAAVGVDIPIGLPDSGARLCDLDARRLLGPRRSSVFPAPIRGMLHARTRAEADAIKRSVDGKGVGYQSFSITGKIRQVDRLMTPALQTRVREAHPELCFLSLTREKLLPAKRTAEGHLARLHSLRRVLPDFEHLLSPPKSRAAVDDVLDALVCGWTARRIVEGTACRLPVTPPFDSKGLRMEIWY